MNVNRISSKNSNIKKIKTEAQDYLNAKMNNMTTSDRVKASREGKRLILVINEFFKSTNEKSLMDLMKAITVKKKKIEVRLNGK